MEKTTWGGYRQGVTVTFCDKALEGLWEDVPFFKAFSLRKEGGIWTLKIWTREPGWCKEKLYATLQPPRKFVGQVLSALRLSRQAHRIQSREFCARIDVACAKMSWEDSSSMTKALAAQQKRDNAPLEAEKWSIWGRKD